MRINWATHQSVKKQWILTAIKCSISVVLLYWVLRKTNLTEIFLTLRSANLPFLIAALLVYFASYYIRAHRWAYPPPSSESRGFYPFFCISPTWSASFLVTFYLLLSAEM